MSAPVTETVVIKKYANRRLYNTATSTYVTLENLSEMVKKGVEFNVYDAKSNEDITRSVLTQIIVEEEGKSGQNLLPIGFLRRLIGFYGDNMQWLVPKYLEHSMQSLSKNQEQIREYFQGTLGMFPFGSTLEQMSKQNLAMFERTMKMFTPFAVPGSEGQTAATDEAAAATEETASSSAVELEAEKPAAFKTVTTPTAVRSGKHSRAEIQEKAEEDAFTPSANLSPKRIVQPVPTPETTKAVQSATGGEDVQNKIAALQRQLSDLAKNKA
jgi:polyhydroxyalkanoate synthesis repressor PhaR